MPTVFTYKGFRFFFYSNEGIPIKEPVHVHVQGNGGNCKIFVDTLQVVDVRGISIPLLNELINQVAVNRDQIELMWNEHFNI